LGFGYALFAIRFWLFAFRYSLLAYALRLCGFAALRLCEKKSIGFWLLNR